MAKSAPEPARVELALAAQIHVGDRYVPFGGVTAAQAKDQAARLADVGTWGPLQRVAKVAHAWKLLASELERNGAGAVGELDPTTVVESAERLWVIPPAGGMVEGVRG